MAFVLSRGARDCKEETASMKLLIASDIHGSAHYCALLMQRVEAEAPVQILLLGFFSSLYHT